MVSEQYLIGERYCSKSTRQILKGWEILGQSFRFSSSDGFYGTERSLSVPRLKDLRAIPGWSRRRPATWRSAVGYAIRFDFPESLSENGAKVFPVSILVCMSRL
jgi:hypothetical protein